MLPSNLTKRHVRSALTRLLDSSLGPLDLEDYREY